MYLILTLVIDINNKVSTIHFLSCWSYVGRQGGRQNISLDEGCWDIGTVVHEIGMYEKMTLLK